MMDSIQILGLRKSFHFILYCCYSDPLKANQDKYAITLNLAGETGDALFGVYDGHGEEGHHCATFCKKKLPQLLAKFVRQKRVSSYTAILEAEGEGKKKGAWNPKLWPLLSTKDFERCCKRAFLETNKALREEKAVRRFKTRKRRSCHFYDVVCLLTPVVVSLFVFADQRNAQRYHRIGCIVSWRSFDGLQCW